jgi:aspartate carbamoyltransferase catalytic subunit
MFREKFKEGIISARDFNRGDIEYLLKKGHEMLEIQSSDILSGKILATLFFEPSTRTRLSFESAMHRLGGKVIGFQSEDVSSVKKGESLADTIRTVQNYSDIIVIRHPMEGSAKMATRYADVPIINAGSGSKEHPTQALLDLLTIKEEIGRLDGLNIGIMGDLKYGRTVHSLAMLLSNFEVNLYFISPKELQMRNRYKQYLIQQREIKFKEITNYRKILDILDVLYMTRIQKERFVDMEEYERVKDFYVFKKKDLKQTHPNFKLMHPLPRITEIPPQIDNSEKAIYFKQTNYGLHMRKAILAELLSS